MSGGTPPYTWAVLGLPPGLSASGAALSGTPTTKGTFTVIALVTDSTKPAVRLREPHLHAEGHLTQRAVASRAALLLGAPCWLNWRLPFVDREYSFFVPEDTSGAVALSAAMSPLEEKSGRRR